VQAQAHDWLKQYAALNEGSGLMMAKGIAGTQTYSANALVSR